MTKRETTFAFFGFLAACFILCAVALSFADDISDARQIDIINNFGIMPSANRVALSAMAPTAGRIVYVPDLGGGGNVVMGNGAQFVQTSLGVLTPVSAASTINQTPLVSPANIKITGSSIAYAALLNIGTTNLYQGYKIHVVLPSGVLGVLGSFGVSLNGASSIPMLGGTWADFEYDGANLIKTGGGNL